MAGRKGYGEELRIKEYLSEITPLMFKYVQEVMDGEDKSAKMQVVTKILPKIVDKGLPNLIEGNLNHNFNLSDLFKKANE